MIKKFLLYVTSTLAFIAVGYLVFLIWWLFLPFFVVLFILGAIKLHQTKRAWEKILKQAEQGTTSTRTHYRKVSDDNVIDVDYEEIKVE